MRFFCDLSKTYAPLLGRILLAFIFLHWQNIIFKLTLAFLYDGKPTTIYNGEMHYAFY